MCLPGCWTWRTTTGRSRETTRSTMPKSGCTGMPGMRGTRRWAACPGSRRGSRAAGGGRNCEVDRRGGSQGAVRPGIRKGRAQKPLARVLPRSLRRTRGDGQGASEPLACAERGPAERPDPSGQDARAGDRLRLRGVLRRGGRVLQDRPGPVRRDGLLRALYRGSPEAVSRADVASGGGAERRGGQLRPRGDVRHPHKSGVHLAGGGAEGILDLAQARRDRGGRGADMALGAGWGAVSLVLRVENRPDDEAWAWCESLDVPARQFFRLRPEQAHEQQVYLVEADAIEHIRGYGFVRLSNGAVGWAIDADLRGQGWGRKMVALLQQTAHEG